MQLVSGSSPSVSRPGDWCDEEVVCVDAFGGAIKATVVSDFTASDSTARSALVDS